MLTMRSGKTIGAWLLVVLWMAQGFLACRAFQSFPDSSTGLSAQYQRAFLGQAKHDVISAQTQVRPIVGRAFSSMADLPAALAIQGPVQPVMPVAVFAVASTLAPPDLAVAWQFDRRAALYPRSPT